jgi:hypothetical protein
LEFLTNQRFEAETEKNWKPNASESIAFGRPLKMKTLFIFLLLPSSVFSFQARDVRRAAGAVDRAAASAFVVRHALSSTLEGRNQL